MLVVDETAENRDALRDYLASKRYDVLSAETASGLVDTVRTRRPHVVLVAVNLLQDTAIIAAVSATAPVIAIATETDVELARRALRDGAFDFVTTPFDFRRVRELIDAAVQHAPDLL